MPIIEKTLGAESKHQVGLLMRYMSGSGEDMPLSDDQSVIDQYLHTVHKNTGGWKPTTNRELNPNTGIPYADEGWEHAQVKPEYIIRKMGIKHGREVEGVYSQNKEYQTIYDKLGKDSIVRRRELEDGNYEYMIVEPWDLIRGSGKDEYGESGSEINWDRQPYLTGVREVPAALAFLHKLAPDFLTTKERGPHQKARGTSLVQMDVSDYGMDWFKNKAKPFNITGSSIIR